MCSFFNHEFLGAFLVFLLVINISDANENVCKKREINSIEGSMKGNDNMQNGKTKPSENGKNFNPQALNEHILDEQIRDSDEQELRTNKNNPDSEQYENKDIKFKTNEPFFSFRFILRIGADESIEIKGNHSSTNGNHPLIDSNGHEVRKTTNNNGNGKHLNKEFIVNKDEPFFINFTMWFGKDENTEVKENDKSKNGNGNDHQERKARKFKFAEAIFDSITKDDFKRKNSTDVDPQESEDVINNHTEGTKADPSETPSSVNPESSTEEEYKIVYDPEDKRPKTLTYTWHEDRVNGSVNEWLNIEEDGLTRYDFQQITRQEKKRGLNPIKKRHPCKPFAYNPFPRSIKFIAHDEKLNGKVKREVMVEEDGITRCELIFLLDDFDELYESLHPQ